MNKTDKYSNEKTVTVSYHLPESIYDSLKKTSKKYHIPMRKIIIGLIDKNYIKNNLPQIILENSQQYTDLINQLKHIKTYIGDIGKDNKQTNNLNKEFIKLQLNDNNNLDDKIKTLINKQEQTIESLKDLKKDINKDLKPLLNDLGMK
ncbi:hypothetical protein [Apilactobacillus timberlakei]|uniref:hypothetical protein n=1 Tax=Apilactobacillus timberlakei TaxID=2008380 RepID=UPI001126096A|nr:hypothetical protein [Apilactobacillus timberlakei]TPR16729.1 hypothetical protein DYZ95_07045 [Apilactobacillus timberlakei]TPR21591.1 hypothetical protein DY083_06095 [Apilactobacillus timberlakei]